MRRLEAIGFWFNPHAPSERPRPQMLVGRWSAARRDAVVRYLRAGTMFERYDSGSFCRFGCGVAATALGRRDLFDGTWLWPEGLAHYVEAHDVRLPERFVRHALRREAQAAAMPKARPRRREGLVDERGWIAWGRTRGAVPTLTGWELPDFAEREAMARELRAQAGPMELVLVRADRSGSVIDVDGALVVTTAGPIVRRKPMPPTVELLSGWDAWPHDDGRPAAPAARGRGRGDGTAPKR